MLCTEFSSVVAETWDDCCPAPLAPPRPGSEAIEYIDMRFAMLAKGVLRRPTRDTAKGEFCSSAGQHRAGCLSLALYQEIISSRFVPILLRSGSSERAVATRTVHTQKSSSERCRAKWCWLPLGSSWRCGLVAAATEWRRLSPRRPGAFLVPSKAGKNYEATLERETEK